MRPVGQVGYSKRSRLEKLGVKRGARIAVVGLDDAAFVAELRERTSQVTTGRLPTAADLVFIYMDRTADLARLKRARAAIRPDGAVWVVWPKGRKAFREDDVRAFGPNVGLVDVKVVAFTETLSGLKLVIPLRDRPEERLSASRSRRTDPRGRGDSRRRRFRRPA